MPPARARHSPAPAPLPLRSRGRERLLSILLTFFVVSVIVFLMMHSVPGGPFDAKFSRHAQTELSPLLEERDGHAVVRVGDREIVVSSRKNAS